VARSLGHETFTLDLSEPADWNANILDVSGAEILERAGWDSVDMLWASPPCDGFSVASIGKMWERLPNDSVRPKHATSALGLSVLLHTLDIIQELQPGAWFIENPRGMMRRVPELSKLDRRTVTYCQYGDTRMKPTDIWTNAWYWEPRPACHNGDPCHERAPRGARTGTQGVKGKRARAALPEALCNEVIGAVSEILQGG
jgi:hypothetical protein